MRFCSQYVGDLQRKDFASDRSWQIVHNYVHNSRNKHRILKQKMTRLRKKVENLQLLLEHLKKNGLLSNKVCNALEVSYSFIYSCNYKRTYESI